MAVQTDFMSAVNQIAAERGISGEEVIAAVADAIKAGFMENFEGRNVILDVNVNPAMGQIGVFRLFNVVKDVVDADQEITLAEAKKYKKDIKVGEQLRTDITPEGDFGRVAAQAAKQAIMQKIREMEKETQLKEFVNRIGEIEYAVVQRMDGDNVIWEVGKTIAIMPATERIANEFYKSGNRHKVLLKAIEETARGKMLVVSRSAPEFLNALFKLEIPELTSESIEIKAIAREAGSRSKVAVVSNVEGIDPIGSCVGQKGMRINAIMNELRFGAREEKIDIILWDANISNFIANAISPAEALKVEIVDAEEQLAKVTVSDEQLSLAIGKDGQNVRLAAKLTGWKIDIAGNGSSAEAESVTETAEGETTANEIDAAKKEASSDTSDLAELGLSARIMKALDKAGVKSVADLKKYADDYTQISGIAKKSAEEIAKATK